MKKVYKETGKQRHLLPATCYLSTWFALHQRQANHTKNRQPGPKGEWRAGSEIRQAVAQWRGQYIGDAGDGHGKSHGGSRIGWADPIGLDPHGHENRHKA